LKSEYPRISIIIPSYNQGSYLEEAIQSVLGQEYPNLELIVIDGGSQDGSQEIIRKYEGELAYFVSEPDRGQSHAVNKGLKKASGDIITFLGSDDKYLPGAFQDLAIRWGKAEGCGAVIGAFQFMNAQSRLDERVIPPYLHQPAPLDLTLGPPGAYRLHQVATFYTKSALDTVGRHVREDLQFVMDRELLYRVCRNFPILTVDMPYGAFRKHKNSKSASQVLPFADEFARIYLESRTGDRENDRKREWMARYRVAKGYLAYANAGDKMVKSAFALIQVIFAYPTFIKEYSYIKAWKHCLLGKGD